MAKQRTFEHPPRGHVGLLVYDSVNDHFRILEVESDTNPALLVGITQGGAQASVDTDALRVGQPVASALRASVDNVPRLPGGVTDLSIMRQKAINDANWLELLSNTSGALIDNLSGRTVADGKRLCVSWGMAGANTSTGRFAFGIGYDTTWVSLIYDLAPAALFAPSVVFYCVGDGSKVWKIGALNLSGGNINTIVSALVWEEDVY